MFEIVAKIIKEDGTEYSFGPMEIPEETCEAIYNELNSLEEQRQVDLKDQQLVDAIADQETRSREASEANAAAAAEGGEK